MLGKEAIKALIQPTLQLHFALQLLDQHRVLVCLNLLLYLVVKLLQHVKGYEQVISGVILNKTVLVIQRHLRLRLQTIEEA